MPAIHRLQLGEFFGEQVQTFRANPFVFTEYRHTDQVDVPLHTHQYAHFALIVDGDYLTSARAAARPGAGAAQLIFNPPGTTHRDRFRSPYGHCFAASVVADQWQRLSTEGSPLTDAIAFGASNVSVIAWRMFREFCNRDAVTPLVLEGLGLELLAYTARQGRSASRGKAPQWFQRAYELMRDRCCESITVREIAATVGVHPYHLARVTRTVTGRSPGELLREYRVQRAASLLSGTTKPIGEIALSCGYSDQSQLTRSFRRAFGATPAAYRRGSA
jgi:AraC family transcriptional regulator